MSINRIVFYLIVLALFGCASNDLGDANVDCSLSTLDLSLISVTSASSCSANDGVIVVEAIGGQGPYVYFINDMNDNTSGVFNELSLGNYDVKVVDANLCDHFINVLLEAEGANLTLSLVATQNTECLNYNGTITASATGGVAPYEYRIDQGPFDVAATFLGLKAGEYIVDVKDSQGCIFTASAAVFQGNTGVSFSTQIQPIIDTKCAISGCHNGDNGAERNWTVFSNVKANAGNIKTRTENRTMPLTGSLSQEQIDLIACWVDEGAQNN